MAKKQQLEGSVPLYHATVAYKLWARGALKARKWTLARFADEIERAGRDSISTAGLSEFLGTEERPPEPSNTKLMPAMNRALGIAPPPLCDPGNELEQLRDRLAARWALLTVRERRALLALLEGEGQGDESSDVTH